MVTISIRGWCQNSLIHGKNHDASRQSAQHNFIGRRSKFWPLTHCQCHHRAVMLLAQLYHRITLITITCGKWEQLAPSALIRIWVGDMTVYALPSRDGIWGDRWVIAASHVHFCSVINQTPTKAYARICDVANCRQTPRPFQTPSLPM